MSDLFGARVSEGTLHNIRVECFEALAAFDHALKQALQTETVVHFDETGMRVNGQRQWLHVACTETLTAYFVHSKRGKVAMDAMDILPQFEGKAVHDGWASYGRYDCDHFLCNAHHLRELTFIWERYRQPWAFQMGLLLGTIKQQVEAAKAAGHLALASELRQAFEQRYQALVLQGWAANPPPPPTEPPPRGRPKPSPAKNLLDRLQAHQAAVLGFMHDFQVPFDNNQAERD